MLLSDWPSRTFLADTEQYVPRGYRKIVLSLTYNEFDKTHFVNMEQIRTMVSPIRNRFLALTYGRGEYRSLRVYDL